MSENTWMEDLFAETEGKKFEEFQPKATDELETEKVVSLETGFQHLEKIVKVLEQKDLPLEKALSLFAEGVNMVQHCTALLNQAEKQVEILLEDSEGRLQTRPASFEAEG